MSRQPKYADFAVRYLVWDGYFGLVTVEEFAACDGYRPRKVRNRGGRHSPGKRIGHAV